MKRLLFSVCNRILWVWILGQQVSLVHGQIPVNQSIDRPKLVVGIVVDQMRYDFLYRYWDTWGNGGFRRLLREGYSFANCTYSYFPTKTAAGHASVYTGTTPAMHGIVGNDWFEVRTGKPMHCVQDDSVSSVGTLSDQGKKSPGNMWVYTISDQLRLATNFKSKTYGVSLKDRGAILPAGHSANAAFWFDTETGYFISSSYYKSLGGKLPAWLQQLNQNKMVAGFRTGVWNPLLPIEKYEQSTRDSTIYEASYMQGKAPVFPYKLSEYKHGKYEIVKRTPFGNTLTTEVAKALIKGEALAKGKETDMIAISYSSTDEVGHEYGPYAIETQDTYLRLDKDLEDLFTFLDTEVGKNQYLVFLTADHGVLEVPQFLKDHGLPAGNFSNHQFLKDLKSFTLSRFDSIPLIRYCINQQIFLDHEKIIAHKLNMQTVLQEIIGFVEKQPQIMNAFAYGAARPFPAIPFLDRYEAGYNKDRSGDIQFTLFPGILEGSRKKGTNHTAPYSYDSHVPLIWMGWKIAPGEEVEPIHIEDIAPTLASLLHIMEPNGCTGKAKKIPLRK